MSKVIKDKVIEDEMTTALNIQNILEKLGHSVTSIEPSGEEALKKLESFNLFLDPGTDSFLLLDSELNIVEINNTGFKSYDLSRKDLVGKNISDLIPDFKKEGRNNKFREVMKTGKPYVEDCLAIYPGVGYRFINMKAIKVGNSLGIIIIDKTDRKKTEQASRVSEERYQLLVENMSKGLIILDENHIITYINNSFLKMNGYARDEIIGQHVTDFLDRESKKIYREKIASQKKNGCGNCELAWERKDGGKVSTKVSPGPISAIHREEEELKKSNEQHRVLSLHLQSVREGESTRIAREIHDELGHLLTALKMDLSWLHKRIPKDQKPLLDTTKSMSKLTDMTIKTVQRISLELRPVILDDLGLVPAIEWHAQEFEDRTNIKCEVMTDCEDIDLDQDRATACFRIFQETLTNVARHANATEIKVSLKEKSGQLLLEIKDNGQGITEEQISDPNSLGLIGIRERIYPWAGELEIKGLPNKGTTLSVLLPVETLQTKKKDSQ
jgi:two-component system sensor histidine kinase UhpB